MFWLMSRYKLQLDPGGYWEVYTRNWPIPVWTYLAMFHSRGEAANYIQRQKKKPTNVEYF